MTMTPLFFLLLVLECSLAAGFQPLQTTRLFLLIILTRNTNLKPELVAYRPPESYQPFIPLFLGHHLNQRCYEIAPAAGRGHAPPLRPPVRRQRRLGARPPAPRPPGVPAVQDGAAGEAIRNHFLDSEIYGSFFNKKARACILQIICIHHINCGTLTMAEKMVTLLLLQVVWDTKYVQTESQECEMVSRQVSCDWSVRGHVTRCSLLIGCRCAGPSTASSASPWPGSSATPCTWTSAPPSTSSSAQHSTGRYHK